MATTNPVLGDTGAKQGQRLLDEHFGAGAGSPAHIIVPQENVDDAMATLSNASDSREAESTVAKIRDELHALPNSVLVGGITATDIDTNLTGERDLRVIIPLVLVAVWVILAILLRALLPPHYLHRRNSDLLRHCPGYSHACVQPRAEVPRR